MHMEEVGYCRSLRVRSERLKLAAIRQQTFASLLKCPTVSAVRLLR